MSTNALEVVEQKIASILEKYPAVDKPLKTASEKTGVKKELIVLGAVVLIPVLILFFICGADIFIDLAGYTYPMYASIKAVETKDKEDDTFWLTYWLVFALFKVIEGVADFLISRVPFYFLIKAAFLIWCYYPTTQGAKIIYSAAIKPYIVPHLNLDAEAKKED